MKFRSVVISLILSFVFSGLAKADPNGQLIVNNVDMMTWPEDIAASSVLDTFIEIMKADPEANLLLNQVNKKLQEHGINHVRDIFRYCSGEPPSDGANAFFWQNSTIVGTRVSVPGFTENPWPQSALEAQKNGYSSQIITTPFLEFLVVTDKPQICIHKGKQLYFAYDSVVHEMVHFLLKNPFSYSLELFSSRPLPDYTQMTVLETGGELDAFKVGTSAGLRFLRKYEIMYYSSGAHKFFDPNAKLSDEEGLKNYLLKIYSDHYKASTVVSDMNRAKLTILETKLQILKTYVALALSPLNRNDLNKALSDEVTTLENLKAQLQSTP